MSDTLRMLARVIYKMPSTRYLNYLRSPQWQRVRQEYLSACDYWCEVCRKARACQVHHWTYERLGREYPQDLVGVCPTCHHKLHAFLIPEVAGIYPAANDNQEQLPLFGQDNSPTPASPAHSGAMRLGPSGSAYVPRTLLAPTLSDERQGSAGGQSAGLRLVVSDAEDRIDPEDWTDPRNDPNAVDV